MLRILGKLATGALMLFGAIVLLALAVDRWAPPVVGPERHEPVRVELAVLCTIAFDVDRARWVKEEYLQNTYRLHGQRRGREVALHVYGKYARERGIDPACTRVDTLRSEKLASGVDVSYRFAECPQGPAGIGPEPAEPVRLYASIDANFLSGYLVAGGHDRDAVRTQLEDLRRIVGSLRTAECKDLDWPMR